MRRIRLISQYVTAACIFAALTAASAQAASAVVIRNEDGPLATDESSIEASSSNLVFATRAGNVECDRSVLLAQLETNQQKKDKLSFFDGFSAGSEAEGECPTTTGLGPVRMSFEGFPWKIEVSKTTVTSKAKEILAITPGGSGITCDYNGKGLKGSFTSGASPMEIILAPVKFKGAKGNNVGCPKEGTLTGTYAMQTGGARPVCAEDAPCPNQPFPWIEIRGPAAPPVESAFCPLPGPPPSPCRLKVYYSGPAGSVVEIRNHEIAKEGAWFEIAPFKAAPECEVPFFFFEVGTSLEAVAGKNMCEVVINLRKPAPAARVFGQYKPEFVVTKEAGNATLGMKRFGQGVPYTP